MINYYKLIVQVWGNNISLFKTSNEWKFIFPHLFICLNIINVQLIFYKNECSFNRNWWKRYA